MGGSNGTERDTRILSFNWRRLFEGEGKFLEDGPGHRGRARRNSEPDGSVGRRAAREPTGVPERGETRCPPGGLPYPPCAVRNRTDKRICLCTTVAGADPCRTIDTGASRIRTPRLRKTSTPASRVRQTAGPRARVLAGGRERFPDGPRQSDTAAILPNCVADTDFGHSIRIEHTSDRHRHGRREAFKRGL